MRQALARSCNIFPSTLVSPDKYFMLALHPHVQAWRNMYAFRRLSSFSANYIPCSWLYSIPRNKWPAMLHVIGTGRPTFRDIVQGRRGGGWLRCRQGEKGWPWMWSTLMATLAPWHKRDRHVSSQCSQPVHCTIPLYARQSIMHAASSAPLLTILQRFMFHRNSVTRCNDAPIISFNF